MASPLHVILAPNAFKNSLSSFEVCHILAKELTGRGISSLSLPMGDGGDGTAKIIAHYTGAQPVTVNTVDALGRELTASYYLYQDTAIIELASSCGIRQLKRNEYNILETNSAGFGIMIRHALSSGYRKLILCIGGSACVDMGVGALIEMGLEIERESATPRNPLMGIKAIHPESLQEYYANTEITVLCDVDNPLYGEKGAAYIFAPQKGASPKQVDMLDQQLRVLASMMSDTTSKQLHPLKHGGAAGGVALSFYALLNASLQSGAEYCLSLSRFEEHLSHVNAVITGEGKIDRQSLYGKIPGTIATLCKTHSCPVYAISGMAEKAVYPFFEHIFTISAHATSIEDSITNAHHYLKMIAQQMAETLYDEMIYRL